MVFVRGHLVERPAQLVEGLQVQHVARVVLAVGEAVAVVPGRAGGAPGDGGRVVRAARRSLGGPRRRVLRPSAVDPVSTAPQQLE